MTGEEHGRVKKAAIQIIERLCSLKSTCMTVVESSGLRLLVQQLACRDISVRLRTARVLQSVAQHDLPDEYFDAEVRFLPQHAMLKHKSILSRTLMSGPLVL